MKWGRFIVCFIVGVLPSCVVVCVLRYRNVVHVRNGSQLVVTPGVIDLGTITQDTVVTRDFLVCNRGTKVVNIDKVVVSCGCTTVDMANRRLVPGESVPMNVKFDSRGFVGSISKKIVLFTDTEGSLPAFATVVGTVVNEGLRLDATRLELGSIHFGDRITRTIHLLLSLIHI